MLKRGYHGTFHHPSAKHLQRYVNEFPDTEDLVATETAVCDPLEITSLGERPDFAVAARRSNPQEQITPKQQAWLGHMRRIARTQTAADFDAQTLEALARRLPRLLRNGPSDLKRVSELLAKCGVRVVFAEGLPGGKLAGAVTFLDDGRPVIGLTMRGDRFDSLAFTLLHECAHLTLGHIGPQSAAILDEDPAKQQTQSEDAEEAAANRQVSDCCSPAASTSRQRPHRRSPTLPSATRCIRVA